MGQPMQEQYGMIQRIELDPASHDVAKETTIEIDIRDGKFDFKSDSDWVAGIFGIVVVAIVAFFLLKKFRIR